MKRIISLSILLTVFLAAFAQGRFKEIEKCFNEPASQSILIVSHRATGAMHPRTLCKPFRTASIWAQTW